ncbi:hypothetical protein F5Y13DRAFT_103565 [Hypoxylon sp. FL1857]|nr:hypothetical protein F5Y13DRAFT_103565 [Hypoxylon sp. FL1857]
MECIIASGDGTAERPFVTWMVPPGSLQQISDARREACERIASEIAMALGSTHVTIGSWNREVQYAYDDRMRNFVEEPADSHMIVELRYHNELHYYGHIYTVDDEKQIPQRLMLAAERRHTNLHDWQSPQLWVKSPTERQRCHPVFDNLGDYIRQQWVDEVILFETERGTNTEETQRDAERKQLALLQRFRELSISESTSVDVGESSRSIEHSQDLSSRMLLMSIH